MIYLVSHLSRGYYHTCMKNAPINLVDMDSIPIYIYTPISFSQCGLAVLWITRSQPLSFHTLGLTAHVGAALSRARAACQRPACWSGQEVNQFGEITNRHGELNQQRWLEYGCLTDILRIWLYSVTLWDAEIYGFDRNLTKAPVS